MSDSIIHVENVSVRYGSRVAVNDVTIDIPRGCVYALLGRNGAGKSSLIRAILGLRRPSSGRVLLFGQDVWSNRTELMMRIGVVPEDNDAPAEMSVAQLERFFASLYPNWRRSMVMSALERFHIAPKTKVRELSKGQSKQVSLALALASEPELLLLDDPTLGLDPVARKSLFEEVITDLADRGTTVMMTTHDLSGVEAIADRVGILRGGVLQLDEDVETLKSRFRRVRFGGDRTVLERANLATAAVRAWGTSTEAVVSNFGSDGMERLSTAGAVADISPLTLEEIFIAVTGEEGAAS
jgi:ABC-2 type transport system ATP-binding protein